MILLVVRVRSVNLQLALLAPSPTALITARCFLLLYIYLANTRYLCVPDLTANLQIFGQSVAAQPHPRGHLNGAKDAAVLPITIPARASNTLPTRLNFIFKIFGQRAATQSRL